MESMSKPDRASDYFKSTGYVPGGILTNARRQALDIAQLPPFLRVLLSMDGTVTKALEGFFWEPIDVENLGQEEVALAHDLPWLELPRGASALNRRVRLIGEQSGTVYAYPQSTLRLDLLPVEVRRDILAGRIGIGELLRECGLETYREILDLGSETNAELDPIFNQQGYRDFIYRTYRIFLNHQPTILITERFPLALFAAHE